MRLLDTPENNYSLFFLEQHTDTHSAKTHDNLFFVRDCFILDIYLFASNAIEMRGFNVPHR